MVARGALPQKSQLPRVGSILVRVSSWIVLVFAPKERSTKPHELDTNTYYFRNRLLRQSYDDPRIHTKAWFALSIFALVSCNFVDSFSAHPTRLLARHDSQTF